jgi:GMP synthase-like glutamine amidotransferase
MRILVLQHLASEHPGNFREVIAQGGHTMETVELDEGETIPPLAEFDALLVMGGPMDVWETDKFPWLHGEMAVIRDWVGAGRPYLGVCLGHQLLAQALGGEVGPMDAPDVGIRQVEVPGDDPLFAGVERLCTCFQWHGAEVKRLPPGGVALAQSPHCAVEALKVGPRAYGLQFHMELLPQTAEDWGAIPEYKAALERVRGPGSMPQIQAEVDAAYAPLLSAAQRIIGNFLALAA